ncbi:MAG: MmcQ/YjbR family DNA-binding protein [Actinomycetota bacterium]|nr:MmcQ/YjbR family DNA-binding protein [Actinomycetota bacterium]
MATWDDVREIALGLPQTNERPSRGHAFWRVRDKGFVWERPLGQTDLRALGGSAPDGPILGVRVENLGVKGALISADPGVFFTIPHFDGYSAVLVRLDQINRAELREVIVEAWLTRAPRRVAEAYAAEHGLG